MNNFLKLAIAVAVVIIIIAMAGVIFWPKLSSPTPVACDIMAKLCPNGSYVARTGPNCEFAACPSASPSPSANNENWQIMVDQAQGITFQYPKQLLTKYIDAFTWPPTVKIMTGVFSCLQAPLNSVSQEKITQRTVDSRTYCVEEKSGGAAGSTYTDYVYTGVKFGQLITVSFTLRYPQCLNYDDPQKTECLNERTAFDLDSLVDRIVASITYAAPVGQSGIAGNVLLGPTCPVMRVPPDPQCADKPYQTALVVATSDRSTVVKEFSSDASGNFRVTIPPGEYNIKSAANGLPRCANNATIKVTAGQFTNATVSCDTGIR